MEAIKARDEAKTSWKHDQLMSVIASNNRYRTRNSADGVFNIDKKSKPKKFNDASRPT